jgi:hypothetical protein
MQGETNYLVTTQGLTAGSNSTTDKDTYKSLLVKLKDNMQTDVLSNYAQTEKPLFITYQVGVQFIKGKEQSIGMAQLEASNENADVVCAGPVSSMTDRGGHLDPNGYRWFGEMLGKVYYKTVVLHENFKPLQPAEISKTELANQLKVKFLVPVMPLVMDSLILPKVTDYGFEVYSDNVKQTITAVKIVDDCVYLSCSAALTGVMEVTYAGQNTVGNGNLRDSDPYQSFYKYIDLDKKNPDNSYVYPRDITETTLRPTYQPKDAAGNVIYDQNYPLYNFGVSFYYKINAGQQTYIVPNMGATTNLKTVVDNGINAHQSANSLVLSTNSNENIKVKVSLFTVSGKLLKSFKETCNSEKKTISLSFPKGIYLAKIEQEDKMKAIKITIK